MRLHVLKQIWEPIFRLIPRGMAIRPESPESKPKSGRIPAESCSLGIQYRSIFIAIPTASPAIPRNYQAGKSFSTMSLVNS
jgi:hypothetical protein